MSSSLNHAYRLVWNEQSQAYVPAPETVKARGKRSGSKKALVAAALSLSIAVGVSAADLPTGGQIVSGSGSITQSGSTMTVTQDTSKLVTNWDSFSIGSGNTVNFLQPSSTAIALNRVLGSDVSVIQGAINANGQVFLINPNGVLFTQTAQVNVGGLLASTLNISTEDFLAGKYTFAGGSSNAIINQGNITAAPGGYVALIAAKIENAGNITAQGGSVLMGAGSRVTVDFGGPVKIEVEEGALETLISNGGAIRADGGLVYLTAKAAGDLASSVINHTGVIEARTLETGQAGKVMLMGDMSVGQLSMTGKIDVSAPVAGNGGFVETSAANVYVADGARVNATAVWGVTGDWLIDPTNFTIASGTGALTTSSIGASTLSTNLASSNVTIQTSSTNTKGNLGDITVAADVTWSSANTLTLQAYNNITLSSGVTITGANLKLDTVTLGGTKGTGVIDTSAGTLIISDSTTLVTGAGNINVTGAKNNFGTVTLASTSGNVSLVDVDNLILGTSTVGGTLGVTTAGALTQSGAATITGATTINTGSGAITLTNAGNDFSSIALTTTGNASVTDKNALVLGNSTVGGLLSLTTVGNVSQVTKDTVVVTGATSIDAGSGDITLTNAGNDFSTLALKTTGNASVNDINALVLGESTVGGTLSVTTAGALTQSGAVTVTGLTTINTGKNIGPVTLDNVNNDFSNIVITTAGNASVADKNGISFGVTDVGGSLSVTAGGAIDLSNAGNKVVGAIALSGSSATVVNTVDTVLGATNLSGDLSLSIGKLALTQTGDVVVGGATSLTAASVTLDRSGNDFSSIALTTTGNASVTDKNALVLGASTVGGDLSLTTSGDITQTGALSVAGMSNIKANGADIRLNNESNQFVGEVTLAGNNIDIMNQGDLKIAGVNAQGLVSLSSTSGDLYVSGDVATTSSDLTAVSVAALTPGYEVLFENKGSNYPQIKTGEGGGWKILTDSLVSKKSGTVYSYPTGVDPDQFFGVKNDNGDYVADTLNKDASGIGILSLANGATANRVYYRSAPLTVSISGMDGMALTYGSNLDTKDLIISVSSIGGGTLTQKTLDRIAREVKSMLTYGEFSASNSDYAVMMLAESGLLKGDAGAWGWGLTRNTSRNGTLLTLASGYGADCSGAKCIQVTAKDLSFMDKGPQGFQTWDKFFDGTDIAYLKEIGLLKDYGKAGIESGDLAGLQLALTNAQAYYLSKNGSTFTSSAAGDFNAVINAFLAGKNTTGYESPGGATGAAAGHQKMVGIYLQGSLTGTRARNYNVNWVSIDKSSIYTMDMILNVNNVIRYQGDNYPNFGYSVRFQCTSDACRVRDWGNLWNNGTGLSFRDEQFRGDHGAFADAIARSYSNGTGRYQIVNPFGRFVPYYDPLDTSLYASGFYPKEMYFGGVPRNPTELDPNGVLLNYGGNPGWNLIEHNPGDLTVIPRVLGAGPIQVTQFSNNGSSAPSVPGALDSLNYVSVKDAGSEDGSSDSNQLADLNVNTFTAGTFSPTDVFVVNGGINNGLALGKNK